MRQAYPRTPRSLECTVRGRELLAMQRPAQESRDPLLVQEEHE